MISYGILETKAGVCHSAGFVVDDRYGFSTAPLCTESSTWGVEEVVDGRHDGVAHAREEAGRRIG